MKKTLSFDYICDEAADTIGMTILQVAQYHYFNKNGAYAAKKASDARISKAVDEGKLKSGSILAYGSMNDYYSERLLEVVRGKRTSRIVLQVIVKNLIDDIKKSSDVIAEINQVSS